MSLESMTIDANDDDEVVVTRLYAGETTSDVTNDDSGGVQRAENEKELATEEQAADGVVLEELQCPGEEVTVENDAEENTASGELGELVTDTAADVEEDTAATGSDGMVLDELRGEGEVTDATATEDDTAADGDDGGGFEITFEEPPQKKKKGNSKIDYPGGSKATHVESQTERVRRAENKLGELTIVQNELYELCKQFEAANTTAVHLICDVRRQLRGDIPQLPALPDPLQPYMTERRTRAAQRTQERNENPIRVDAGLLIQRLVEGVRDGIDRGQAPQVLFCLAFLIPLRSNDLNPAHARKNTDRRASAETHLLAEKTKSGVVVVGTLLNRWPSKDNPNCEPPSPYGAPFICDKKHYPLMRDALEFVFTGPHPPCTRTQKEYQKNVPSGPGSGNEWGNAMHLGIHKPMMKRLKLTDALVAPTGTWEEQAAIFTKGNGRAFASCAIEQGRFVTESDLLSAVAFTRGLGHRPMAVADHNYRKFRCENVTPVAGVVLRKIIAEDPLLVPNDGLSDDIVNGLYLTSAPAQGEEAP
mmetsp:Transcript_33551/g.107201  ORF Transcript_33551/g.107201 Transcript_33551/m.107201 type:complete len:533 (+) Transcript_33551:142-1740(+)